MHESLITYISLIKNVYAKSLQSKLIIGHFGGEMPTLSVSNLTAVSVILEHIFSMHEILETFFFSQVPLELYLIKSKFIPVLLNSSTYTFSGIFRD